MAQSTPVFPQRSPEEDLPNIIVLVFDALTARNMSLYGYPRLTTPHLERFAANATVFHRHYAAGNFTTSGTASLLTGVYPWSHRAIHLHGRTRQPFERNNLFSQLHGRYHTFAYTHNPLVYILLHQFRGNIDQLFHIPELCLRADSISDQWFTRDYNIAYEAELTLLRNGYDPSGSLFFSLFDRLRRSIQGGNLSQAYRDQFPRQVPNYFDEEAPSFLYFTLEQAIDWLQSQVASSPKPFLGYVHLLPPHGPYTTRAEFIDRFDDHWQPPTKPEHLFSEGHTPEFLVGERRLYDEFIAYADQEFGRLYDFMPQNHFLENTWLIFTSDHGEMFERGIYTHITPTLYDPVIHIPLLVASPGQRTRRDVRAPTSAVDLLPMLCRIAGGAVPAWCEGQLLPGLFSDDMVSERSVYAVEAKQSPKNGALSKATYALIDSRYKLIRYTGYPELPEAYELYDLIEDPEELKDLYAPSDPVAAALKEELAGMLARVGTR